MTTSKNWAVSKVKDIVVATCANTKAGWYEVLSYKPLRKFNTQAEARNFRRWYTGKDRVQVINTRLSAVSR